MLDEHDPPDWEYLSQLTAIKYRMFASEQYKDQVLVMYNEIVSNPDADNNELTSSFLSWCSNNSMLKLMFNTWLAGFEDRPNGPITCKEILQFISYLSMCEERHVTRLLKEGLKP